MSTLEFQPVVFAAGRGSRMADITAKIPKSLLPVGNLPLIMYPLLTLDKYGFEEAIILVLKSQRNNIESALRPLAKNRFEKLKRIEYVSVPDEEDWGTADSLRSIKDKVKCDVLVISCDLIADIPVYKLAELHLAHSASITALFSSNIENLSVDTPVPGSKSKKKSELDFIGLEENTDRLLFLSSETDYDDSIDIRKSVLRRHPCIDMYSRLTDAHFFLISKRVINLLPELKYMTSLKGEVIPYIIKLQYRRQKKCNVENKSSATAHLEKLSGKSDPLFTLAAELSSWNDHHSDMDDCYHDSKVRCYGHVMADEFCIRVNTVSNYCEANRQIGKHLHLFKYKSEQSTHSSEVQAPTKKQVSDDSMIGDTTRIAEKVSIKKSMIGLHCTVAEKVRITNSIIMNHVTINEGCNIQNSIICENANIGEKSELKDTIVGSAQNINAMSKFTNEVIIDLDQMMEI